MQCKKNNVNSIVAIVAFQYRLYFFCDLFYFLLCSFCCYLFYKFYVRFFVFFEWYSQQRVRVPFSRILAICSTIFASLGGQFSDFWYPTSEHGLKSTTHTIHIFRAREKEGAEKKCSFSYNCSFSIV